MPGPKFGFVKLLCLIRPSLHLVDRWAAQTSRVRVSARYDLPLPFIPTLIGRRAFDLVSVKSCLVVGSDKYNTLGKRTNPLILPAPRLGLLLWHISQCRLFNAKSNFIHTNSSISNNSVSCKYIFFLFMYSQNRSIKNSVSMSNKVLFQTTQFSITIQFKRQEQFYFNHFIYAV